MSEKANAAKTRRQGFFAGKKEGEYLISLLRSSLHGEPPMPAPEGLDWAGMYALAERQLVSAAVWRALKDTDFCPAEIAARFRAAADGALRKELLFDAARAEIFAAFDEQKIDYMPLKGVLIKDLYPAKGMRQFADNDILYRERDRRAADEIMCSLEYEREGLESVHDVYMKPPVYNFELHRALFEERYAFSGYFDGIWDRAVKDAGDNSAWHMTDEDFYAYFIAHFQKHYEGGGAGLRSFADLYLLHRKISSDAEKTAEILQKTGLADFERQAAQLADDLFGDTPAPLSDEALAQVFPASAYGTMEREMENLFRERGRIGGALRLAFPPYRHMKTIYPVLQKAPVLLPVMWLVRLFTVLFGKKRGKAAIALKTFLHGEGKDDEHKKADQ